MFDNILLYCTVYNGYSDIAGGMNLRPNYHYNHYTVYNGYSDILDIVILLSLSIFPHLHIRHTKFIGYSDTVYNGYSDIAGGMNLRPNYHYNLQYTVYNGYSDILDIVIYWI